MPPAAESWMAAKVKIEQNKLQEFNVEGMERTTGSSNTCVLKESVIE